MRRALDSFCVVAFSAENRKSTFPGARACPHVALGLDDLAADAGRAHRPLRRCRARRAPSRAEIRGCLPALPECCATLWFTTAGFPGRPSRRTQHPLTRARYIVGASWMPF